ncbi:MAG TPA: transglutaminase family protein [Xanthobacteraceae bacterium]|nr:transglutaminase family protein [Xanthobacteraceae bacterium]
MRIRLAHETVYTYGTPAKGVIQTLRLTPRNHDGQHIIDWRIDVTCDCRLDQHEDAFGNITHTFSADGPLERVSVTVDGTVETQDTAGLVRDAVERFPPSLFLRETALTLPDAAIQQLSDEVRAHAKEDRLEFLHTLMSRLHGEMEYDEDPTHVTTRAALAYEIKRGVCQDFTHVFLAAARCAGIPARYISGYFCRTDRVEQNAGHAWAEAHVDDFGWLAFDPTHGICPMESHIRVAAGLDYLGAAPVRGSRFGGGGESLAVNIRVQQAQRQSQN